MEIDIFALEDIILQLAILLQEIVAYVLLEHMLPLTTCHVPTVLLVLRVPLDQYHRLHVLYALLANTVLARPLLVVLI